MPRISLIRGHPSGEDYLLSPTPLNLLHNMLILLQIWKKNLWGANINIRSKMAETRIGLWALLREEMEATVCLGGFLSLTLLMRSEGQVLFLLFQLSAAEVKFGLFFKLGRASQSALPRNASCLSVSLCPRTLLTTGTGGTIPGLLTSSRELKKESLPSILLPPFPLSTMLTQSMFIRSMIREGP